MLPGEIEKSLERLEQAVTAVAQAGCVPVVLGGDHTITFPDATGVAHRVGWGRLALVHFDAHADTANTQFGSLYGHGTPMRRLIESGAVRGERFFQIGLRGYWPDPATLDWMAAQGMRSYEMAEVGRRGLGPCLDEVFALAMDGCDAVFLSVDIDVVDPGMAPGTGTPEPGGLSARELLDAVRRCAMELPLAGLDIVEVSPPYDHAQVTAYLANRVVLEALSGMAWRRRKMEGPGGAGPEGFGTEVAGPAAPTAAPGSRRRPSWKDGATRRSPRRSALTKELRQPGHAFGQIFVGQSVGEPAAPGRSERLTGHEGHLGLVEHHFGQFQRGGGGAAARAERLAKRSGKAWEGVERTLGLGAHDAGQL